MTAAIFIADHRSHCLNPLSIRCSVSLSTAMRGMRVALKHGLTEHSDDLLGRVAIRLLASKGQLILGSALSSAFGWPGPIPLQTRAVLAE